jgi:hypothetical protein
MKWAGLVTRIWETRAAYMVLVGKPEVKGALGRPRRRWEDNIKADLQEMCWGGRDWFAIAQIETELL